MKFTSLGLIALVLVMAFAILAGDSGTSLPSGYAGQFPSAPSNPPVPDEQRLLPHEQFAVLTVTGREVIDAMHAEEGNADTLPRERDSRGSRTPERQARGLSGSA